jgi:hypothetical protein
MTGVENHDPEYVAARRVLLDALEALGPHRKAVVLVGAQAIYLHVGEGDMAVAPFTTDGDLAINPGVLDDEPILAEALRAAGFGLAVNPGTWSMKVLSLTPGDTRAHGSNLTAVEAGKTWEEMERADR